MSAIDAFHLPGLKPEEITRWNVREYDHGKVRLRVPVLEPATLERIITGLRAARARTLAEMPVAEIVHAVDAAAARLARDDDPLRRLAEEALPAVTGYSPAMVRLILERMVPDWRADALGSLLRAEFGDPGILDEFRPRPGAADGARVRAYGPELAFHIFAGNVPGVAVTSLVRSLLVKAATLGKTASGDPLLAVLFAKVLAETAPRLAECLAVTYWPGGSTALEDTAYRTADLIVVYGGRETVDAVRSGIPPETRLVEHGPRFSLALIAREALAGGVAGGTAAAAALAVATFDQQGCVSPHVVYVERGGDLEPGAFAELLAGELARIEKELPRGRLSPAEAATIQQLRGGAEFRALAGQDVRLFTSPGTEYTVIFDADPAFTPSCLNRVVWVKPLDELGDVTPLLRPYGAYLQTVGIAAPAARQLALAGELGRVGASRITDLDRMPWPPAAWHHDGQSPLGELVRWVDLEG